MEPSADWRHRSACRRTKVEMAGADTRVRRAKALCSVCPVRIKCLLAAQKLTLDSGADAAQGVWGGLTQQERATMAGTGRLPAPCTRCGQECVPINLATTECSACKPTARLFYEDYRLMIETMLRDGNSYQEIADRLHLRVGAVKSACGRWKLRSTKRSPYPEQKRAMECGTLAAKYRHHRKEKYSWRDCPKCRFVPWNKGPYKGTRTAAA